MRRTGITHIIRAHQPPNLGISFGKRAQVITVFSSSHYCLDGDTPVTLPNGLSMRIRELADCPEVRSFSFFFFLISCLFQVLARGPNGTFVPAAVSAHLNQGQKECRELIFRDRRKLVCTPDHKILTTDGWCRADALVAGKSQVILGLEGPLYSPADDDPAHLAAFELTLGEVRWSVDLRRAAQ